MHIRLLQKQKNHTENKGEEGAGGQQCGDTTDTRFWEWRLQRNYLVAALTERSWTSLIWASFHPEVQTDMEFPIDAGKQRNRRICMGFENATAPFFVWERGLYKEEPAHIYFPFTAVILIRRILWVGFEPFGGSSWIMCTTILPDLCLSFFSFSKAHLKFLFLSCKTFPSCLSEVHICGAFLNSPVPFKIPSFSPLPLHLV